MKITVCALGKLKSSPELDLVKSYQELFMTHGKRIGLGPVVVHEIDNKKTKGISDESKRIRIKISQNNHSILCDERGKEHTSIKFSELIIHLRNKNIQKLLFVIGGANGVEPALREEVDQVISFGKMVWPHMLVRVMLMEQLYRASAILLGTPYHRE